MWDLRWAETAYQGDFVVLKILEPCVEGLSWRGTGVRLMSWTRKKNMGQTFGGLEQPISTNELARGSGATRDTARTRGTDGQAGSVVTGCGAHGLARILVLARGVRPG